MLKAFRTLSKSRIGALLFGLFLVAVAASFALADIQNLGFPGGGPTGSTVAEVGGEEINLAELRLRVQRAYDVARQQDPTLTMEQFIARGGVEGVLNRMIDGIAAERFAKSAGIGVSRRMEDGQIASAQAFRGLDGRFDQSAFEAFLQREGLTERQVRADIARDLYLSQLIVPASGATRAPEGLALPYASMLLEVREGQAMLVPAAAFRPAAPDEAALTAFYRQNIGRYTIPPRRVIRYAAIDRAALPVPAPSEAEIAEAYRARAADYAARETRTLAQVILPTQATATALAAQVRGGTSIADAARAAGLEAVTLTEQSRADYARTASEAVAEAAFAAPEGGLAAVARSPLGWHVVRVEDVQTVPARTLDQVRGEITERLAKEKADTAFADAVVSIEEAVADGASFDEVVQANRLQPVTTPPLLETGRPADAPADAAPSPELAALVKAGFAADPEDDPMVEQVTANERALLFKVEQVLPPTPRPLAAIRDQVAEDYLTEQSLAAARAAAEGIAQRARGATGLAEAAKAAPRPLPAPQPIAARRGELLRRDQAVPPELATLFTLTEGNARVVPAADNQGWYVVELLRAQRGDARSQPGLIQSAAAQFGPVLGQEYAQQLIAAARQKVGVEINQDAVATLKRELTGANQAQ